MTAADLYDPEPLPPPHPRLNHTVILGYSVDLWPPPTRVYVFVPVPVATHPYGRGPLPPAMPAAVPGFFPPEPYLLRVGHDNSNFRLPAY